MLHARVFTPWLEWAGWAVGILCFLLFVGLGQLLLLVGIGLAVVLLALNRLTLMFLPPKPKLCG